MGTYTPPAAPAVGFRPVVKRSGAHIPVHLTKYSTSTIFIPTSGDMYLVPFNPSRGFSITHFSLMGNTLIGGKYRPCVYTSDSDGMPSLLGAVGNERTIASVNPTADQAPFLFDFEAGTEYWVGIHAGTFAANMYLHSVAGVGQTMQITQEPSGGITQTGHTSLKAIGVTYGDGTPLSLAGVTLSSNDSSPHMWLKMA